MEVILIGAGRYGNSLVGRKYVEGELGAKLIGVVDPKIDEIKNRPDYKLGDTPTYRSLDEIPKDVFNKKTVAEIAIIPKYIPYTFEQLSKKGIKNVILPKPVTSDMDSFETMKETAAAKGIKTAVASNWHYSKMASLTRAILDKTRGKKAQQNPILEEYKQELAATIPNLKIKKVEIEYNKKQEVLTIDPPSQELPHALQIAYSTGLTNFENVDLILDARKQSKSRVNVTIQDKESDIPQGIEINSDLNMGDKLDKQRERLLKIYLDDDDSQPDIVIDYDAKFSPLGHCEKHPNIEYDISRNGKRIYWKTEIKEDNMNVMYDSMFDYFKGKKQEQKKALTLEKYTPISNCICIIQDIWESIVRK